MGIAQAIRERPRLQWALVFGVGVALRIALFSGYGLGDDPNYFTCYHGIYRSGTYHPADPYAIRFGIWVPVVLSMKLLGVTEAGFVGAMTFCSFVNLVLVYLLARQEWERPYALLAMGLMAVFPLEVLCSTLFANDILLATYCFTALWLYRKAITEGAGRRTRLTWAAASALFLLIASVTKPWAVLVGPLFLTEGVKHWRKGWPYVLATATAFALLVGGYLGWQWARFGDPLFHISIARPLAIFLPYSRDLLLDYPRMLFLPNGYRSYFAGFHPHALVLLALLFVWRAPQAGKWLAFLAVMLLGLAALPSHRVNGQWVTLVPHIFRYLCLVSIPLCLALAAYLRELFLWRRTAGAALAVALLGVSVAHSVALTEPTRDAFGEERRAIAVLRQFPDERVRSDSQFLGRFYNFELKASRLDRIGGFKSETLAGRAAEFTDLTEAVVVTGGGRLPWYGCFPCTADLGDFAVPSSWTLVTTFAGRPLTQYRHEPLRVWRVSRAALRAREQLADRPDAAGRRDLLATLVEQRDYDTAAEVGRQILQETPDVADDSFLTGKACAQSGKIGCALRHLAEAVALGLPEPQAREALVLLVTSSTRASDFEQARRWTAELRHRFPAASMDSQLAEIQSGMSEGVTRYHEGRLADARRIFATILTRDRDPERRKRALYFLALTLFHMGRLSEAVAQASAYRSAYGEDGAWVELRYREGEALLVTDARAARDVLAEVASRFPGSYWATEAGRQLGDTAGAGK